MIEFQVSPRDLRTVIAGGVVILSVLAIGRGLPAWYRWRNNVAGSTGVALVQASAATRSAGRARGVYAAMKRAELQRMELSPAFVNGSGAVAAANLASIVGEAATANGMRMGTLQASSDSAPPKGIGVTRVRVRGDATGDVRAVTQFLAALESGVPLIAVREVSVTQGEPNASADHPESLRVEFVLEALANLDSTDDPR